jgi:class 3 adenylate cyclase
MPIERKLAAIMFTDIAGYTAQMSKDEAVAISLLNKKESVLKPLIAKHNGTYVKSTGDGSLLPLQLCCRCCYVCQKTPRIHI